MRAALIAPTADPAPTGLSPNSGPVGEDTPNVVVQGTDFGNGTKVLVDGIQVASDYKNGVLSFTAPADPTAHTATVLLKEGNKTFQVPNGFQYKYVTPVLSSLTPTTQISGGTITVNGQHLTGATAVSFGGATAAPVNPTPDSLTVTVPDGTGTVNVTVTTPGGTSNGLSFTYGAPAPPTVTQVSPNQGVTAGGTTVTITGTGFTTASTVAFGSTPATGVTVTSTTSITATAPAGTGTVDVRVTTASGTSAISANDRFTYGPAPTVTQVSPDFGPQSGGTAVTITGTGFTSGTSQVFFGSKPATTVVVVDATTITAVAPSGTGTVTVTVTNAYGPSNGGVPYVYFADDCTSSTGNFGYLDVPRKDGTTNVLEVNIIKGLDHRPGIFPPAKLPAVNTQCLSGSTPIDGALLDNPPKDVVEGVNCLDVQNGNKVSAGAQALLDGINNPKLDAKLANPADPPNSTNGSVAGRPPGTLDSDRLSDFIAPGFTMQQFITQLAAEPTGHVTMKFFTADIVNCPRFAILPVLHINGNQPNGLYPVVGFVGAFIEDFNQSNNQIKGIQAWVFPLDWLPDVIGQSNNGTTDYIGTGPVIPLLVN